jgi:peptidoglycan/LPS O-acetylase OafA/YrhL
MRIKKLDGMRGVFSLMVVVFHYPDSFLPKIISNNFFVVNSDSFVDFFFVLSGFVISYNYYDIKSANEFVTYLKKRIIRLYPLLFLTVITLFSYEILLNILRGIVYLYYPDIFNSFQGLDFSTHILIPVSQTIDSLLMLNSTPIMGNGGADIGMNGPTWSISSEMISYVFLGLFCLYLKKWREVTFFTVIVISIISLFVLDEYFLTGDFGFIRGLLSFFTGSFVYIIYNSKKPKINSFFEWFSIIILVVMFFVLNETRPGLEKMFPIITPVIFGIIIYTFLGTRGTISKILESRPLQYLGEISYSIYLNHIVLMSIVLSSLNLFLPLNENLFVQVSVFILFIILLLTISRITYLKVELKWNRYLRSRLKL